MCLKQSATSSHPSGSIWLRPCMQAPAGLTKQQLTDLVYQTVDANGMHDHVHSEWGEWEHEFDITTLPVFSTHALPFPHHQHYHRTAPRRCSPPDGQPGAEAHAVPEPWHHPRPAPGRHHPGVQGGGAGAQGGWAGSECGHTMPGRWREGWGCVCGGGRGAARGADQLKCRRDTCTVCAPLSGCQPLHPPHPTPHPTPCTGGGYPALHLPRAAGRARRAGGGGGSGRGWELGDGAHDAALCCAMTSAPRHPAMPSTVDASQAGWALRPKMAREVACRDACVPHSLRWPAYRIRAGTRTPSSTASRPASRCRSWCEGKTVWHGVM